MASAADGLPTGWFASGSDPQDYEMGRDSRVARSGAASGYIKARADNPAGFATLMQTFAADAYRGKRVRLTGYARAADVAAWAGLWMRVDGRERSGLRFDNMEDRPIKGTSDWAGHHIVLDVPADGAAIAFGVLLQGPGQVWVDDFRLESVGDDVPTTGRTLTRAPVNLGFED